MEQDRQDKARERVVEWAVAEWEQAEAVVAVEWAEAAEDAVVAPQWVPAAPACAQAAAR